MSFRRNEIGPRDIDSPSKHVNPTERITVCRDLKDNKWLELAVTGNSAWLVTGDDDLLALDGFRGIAITTPAVFVRSLTN